MIEPAICPNCKQSGAHYDRKSRVLVCGNDWCEWRGRSVTERECRALIESRVEAFWRDLRYQPARIKLIAELLRNAESG